jgi:hypothetical protein
LRKVIFILEDDIQIIFVWLDKGILFSFFSQLGSMCGTRRLLAFSLRSLVHCSRFSRKASSTGTNDLSKMCITGPKTTLLLRSFLCGKAGVLRIQGTTASCPFSSSAAVHVEEKKNALYLKPSKNTASSNDWLKRQLSDPYVRWARVDQYRL